VVVTRAAAALLVLVLTGCAGEPEGPGDVRVQVGAQDVTARPVQYCQDGERVRYDNAPPVVEASPDAQITLTVPETVAERGWSVQVFDEGLEELLGAVDVPAGEERLTEINTSDVVPPAFYLVVVEDKGGDCGEWSGAWPIGFLRAGGDLGGPPSSSAPPAG
jgi:glucose/arabinose dehydrogenase